VPSGRHDWPVFEHTESRRRLLAAFDEPAAKARSMDQELVALLEDWRRDLHSLPHAVVGMKQPLLCLMGPHLERALRDDDVRFVSCDRERAELVESLARCNWRWTRGADLRAIVDTHCTMKDRFLNGRAHCRVQFDELLKSPRGVVARLV